MNSLWFYIPLIVFGLPSDQFHHVFRKEFEFSLNSEEHHVAYFRDLAVDTRGNYFLIDFAERHVIKYDRNGQLVRIFGGRGAGPGEFEAPLAIATDDSDYVYVADNSLRRISIFNDKGEFLRSFIIGITHWVPRTMRIDAAGNIFMAGLQEGTQPLTGTWIQKYSPKGKLINSFYEVEEFAYSNNLTYYSRPTIDMDRQGNIYGIHKTVNKVSCFNSQGKLLNSFQVSSKYIIPPPEYPDPYKWRALPGKVKDTYHNSWTPFDKIVVTSSDLIILSIQLNDLHREIDENYLIQVYDNHGHLISGDLFTNYRLLVADENDFIYFLTDYDDGNEEDIEYKLGKFKIDLRRLNEGK